MALSNAERQRLYIKRLKAKAAVISPDPILQALEQLRPMHLPKGYADQFAKRLVAEAERLSGKPVTNTSPEIPRSVSNEKPAAVSNGATQEAEARIQELEAELVLAREENERAWRHARLSGKFTSDEYRAIKACLHPEGVTEGADKKRHEKAYKAFTTQLPEVMFREKKKAVAPNAPPPMPGTASEWDAARQRTTEKRKAKRRAARSTRRSIS